MLVPATIFDSFLSDTFMNNEPTYARFSPSFDVMETDNTYEIHAEVPGLKKSDFDVTFDKGLLTISGEKKASEQKEGTKYWVAESRYGKFTKKYRLPENVDGDNITAKYKDGVLTITVNKVELPETKRLIKVN